MGPAPASNKPGARAVYVVGIAGPSASGKSTLAQVVASRLGGVVFALDAYHRDQRHLSEDEIDVDIPDAIEASLAAEHLRALVAGRPVDQPVYDFATHTRTGRTQPLAPGSLVVVEGLFALYWAELRALMHTRAFIALGHDECLRRRSARDVRDRGRTHQEVVAMYERKVRPMYDAHVDPTRAYADLVLDGRVPIDELTSALLAALRYT
jgi:uridine kinase